MKGHHGVDGRHDSSIETGIAGIDNDDKASADEAEESIREKRRSGIGLMGELERGSSIFSGHGREVSVLESSLIVVLEVHRHVFDSMFVVKVGVDDTALRGQVVGSHLARLCEMYGGG